MKKPPTQETKALRITAVIIFVGMAVIIWVNSQTIDIDGEREAMRQANLNSNKQLEWLDELPIIKALPESNVTAPQCRCYLKEEVE